MASVELIRRGFRIEMEFALAAVVILIEGMFPLSFPA